jgi:hypothetical protein
MTPAIPCECRSRPAARAAFSLSELLIAMAIALMVMAALASLFGFFGRAVSQSQGLVDLSSRMRSTAWQLRQDLAGVTVELGPWTRPEANSGYFELLEGPQRDTTLAGAGSTNLEGDTDDTLLFTTRAVGEPFVGRFGDGTLESDCAEVAWFCRPASSQPVPGTTLYNLHRRQLLVMGYVGQAPFLTGPFATPVPIASLVGGTPPTPFFDLSLRLEGGNAAPNTLADLSKRENRCFFTGTGPLRNGTFPFAVLTDASGRMPTGATFEGTGRMWEDVLLTNVIAFDVRVFDPRAAGGGGAEGGYVDLGQGGGTPTAIASGAAWPPAGTPALQSAGMQVRNAGTNNALPPATFDTWSLHYESNRLNEDDDTEDLNGNNVLDANEDVNRNGILDHPLVDEGTNGLDDNGNGVPDDPAEYETSPPYPVPLRGIEVRIRCYDPASRQVRQVTVRHSFLKK